MKLRPHHLLCTQGYSGKGYNEDFVKNMNVITSRLRSGERTKVDIVFSTDDICSNCPNMIAVDLCKDNDKVKRYDKKVVDYFDLEEKSYIYHDIIREINAKMTASMMDDICQDCAWYPISACSRIILSGGRKSD